MRREPRDRNVGAHGVAPAGAEQVGVRGLVGGRVPRSHRAVGEREASVGNHLLEVDADDATEPLARRAGPERRVEREERGRRIAELPRAVGTVQAAAEHANAAVEARLERTGQREGRLGRRRDLGPRRLADHEPADDHAERARGIEQARRVVSDLDGLAGRRDGTEEARPAVLGQPRGVVAGRACAGAPAPSTDSFHSIGATSVARAPASEAHSSSTARSTPPGIAGRPQSGHVRLSAVREEQPQRVVDLRLRPDRRAGVADAVLLLERDGRRHGLDGVDVGTIEPLQELTGVRRERLRVPPLPLRVERVERQGRLARAGDAGDHGEPRRAECRRRRSAGCASARRGSGSEEYGKEGAWGSKEGD